MLVFDLETDGFVSQASQIHCLAIYDTETNETMVFNDQGDQEPVVRGVQLLDDAEEIAGHNIIGFDLPIIRKFFPWFQRIGDCLDTLLLSRLYHPNLIDIDKRHCWKHMPLQLYGRHSLEAYGYRLGEYKGEFGKDTDWKEWSQSMQDYMVQDVVVTNKLCEHFHPYLIGSK